MTPPSCPIHITDVHPDQIPVTVNFVMQARAQMFPMLDPCILPNDLQHFADTYRAEQAGCFKVAHDAERLVGVIGFLPYDGRFEQLDYHDRQVVEVVRLFIDPAYRRLGVAARLFAELKASAQSLGIDVLYLHTHPFLPGAITFWQRQGFAIVDLEDDPVWQTVHMQCLL